MNYCRGCGKIVDNNVEKCPFCGTYIDNLIKTEPIHVEEDKNNEYNNMESKATTEKISIENYNEVFKGDNTIVTRKDNNVHMQKNPLNNWIKVTLSILILLLPGLGSIIGIISAIVFMNNEDEDRRTFGYALLTYSIVFLILICACCMVFSLSESMEML